MANWAWPHTPSSNWSRLVLQGGPFDGEEIGFLPPDVEAPIQIAWSGWFPWGFASYLYEWHGDLRMDRGRVAALVYRPPIGQADDMRVFRGRRLAAHEIPPVVAEAAEDWADGADLLVRAFDVPPELMWPGI